MIHFLLFLILAVLCWPLALIALVLFPIVRLPLIPCRSIGLAIGGLFELIGALFYLPARTERRGSKRVGSGS